MVPPVPATTDTAVVNGYFYPTLNKLTLSFKFDFTLTSNTITGCGLYAGTPSVPASSSNLITSITGYSTTLHSGDWSSTILLTPAQITDLFAGNIFVVIATNAQPGGELRGQLPAISNVIIDGVSYSPFDFRTFYFEGVRTLNFSSTQVIDIKLIESTVNMMNCRSDQHFIDTNNWPYRVDVDSGSQIVATELYYGDKVSENIFVNSIAYDGSSDIYDSPSLPTSVWGPLRNTLVKKVYSTLPYNVKYGSLLDGTSPISFGVVNSVQVAGGVLGTTCAKLFIPPGTTASLDCGFSPIANKYYLWSIHALQDTDNISGKLKTTNSSFVFGQVILKNSQWACSYGIKKCTTNTTDTVHLSLTNNSSTNDGILYLADVQVLEFSNYADAVSFAQSRAFISIVRSVAGPTHTTTLANVYIRWDAAESSFAIENDFNIAAIERIDVGVYDLSFVLPLENIPIVQLTPEFLKTDEGNETAVVASFENLSVDGVRVRLQQLVEGTPLPVDCSYSFSVQ